jgi:hypothetical protein
VLICVEFFLLFLKAEEVETLGAIAEVPVEPAIDPLPASEVQPEMTRSDIDSWTIVDGAEALDEEQLRLDDKVPTVGES